jgi:hypothetical protein
VNAFRAFSGVQGLISSLGHFSQSPTLTSDVNYNMMLELADCNLDDWFETQKPPQQASEIRPYWQGFLDVARAIDGIHRFSLTKGTSTERFNG